uniref:Kelch-like protein diablo n=1 Tax=Rhipicephalus appendiculatus TaxID=34631 RepID=A0A131Z4T7_RHIAP
MFSGSVLLPGGDATGDCTLRTSDGGSFEAQRAYLATVSPYFAAMFREQFGAQKDVVVSGVSAAVLDALLTYQYTDQLCVNAHNILEVLRAADMLLLEEARKQCLMLLLKTMGINNCLGLATLTRQYYFPNFSDTVFAFLRSNFEEIWQRSEEFPDTPAWLMYDLLSSPELNVEHEENALQAIAKWWTTGAPAAAPDANVLLQLLQCVRIGRCRKEALDQFASRWPLLVERVEYQTAIVQALRIGPCMCTPNKLLIALTEPEKPPQPAPPANMAPNPAVVAGMAVNEAGNPFVAQMAFANVPVLFGQPIQMINGAAPAQEPEPEPEYAPMDLRQAGCEQCGLTNPERWLPRLPSELIFVIGGWSNGQPRDTIETYDPRVDRWFEHKDPNFTPRAYHGVVLFRRRLYVLGGMKLRFYLRSIESYDLDRGQWNHHSPMHVPRAYVAAAALGEHIYAMGGHTGVERTSTVERYSVRTNQWTMVARMMRRRSDGAACAFKGRLYISGGFNGRKVLESVEEYNPSLDSWSLVRPLPYPRCSHRMFGHGGRLYVIGGFDGRRRLHTVLKSDESLPLRWHRVPSLNCARSTFAVATLGDVIYVIGGFNGTSLVATVECYTPGEKHWQKAKSLNGPVSALAGCVLSGINVTRKFSARGALLPPANPQVS